MPLSPTLVITKQQPMLNGKVSDYLQNLNGKQPVTNSIGVKDGNGQDLLTYPIQDLVKKMERLASIMVNL